MSDEKRSVNFPHFDEKKLASVDVDKINPTPESTHDHKIHTRTRSESSPPQLHINTGQTNQPILVPYPVLTREDFRALVGITSVDYTKLDHEATDLTTPGPISAMQIRSKQRMFTNQLAVKPQRTYFHLFKRGNTFTNQGLYRSVCLEEERARWRYHTCNLLINCSLIAQLALSAAVIALGAQAGDFHIPVTVIGAFNGVLAGFLSLIKGQGIPARILQYRNALRRVREAVERVDRMCERPGSPPVTYLEVEAIFRMFNEARRLSETNHPDIWNSETTEVQKMIDKTPGTVFTSQHRVLGEQPVVDHGVRGSPERLGTRSSSGGVFETMDEVVMRDPNAPMMQGGTFQPGHGSRPVNALGVTW